MPPASRNAAVLLFFSLAVFCVLPEANSAEPPVASPVEPPAPASMLNTRKLIKGCFSPGCLVVHTIWLDNDGTDPIDTELVIVDAVDKDSASFFFDRRMQFGDIFEDYDFAGKARQIDDVIIQWSPYLPHQSTDSSFYPLTPHTAASEVVTIRWIVRGRHILQPHNFNDDIGTADVNENAEFWTETDEDQGYVRFTIQIK